MVITRRRRPCLLVAALAVAVIAAGCSLAPEDEPLSGFTPTSSTTSTITTAPSTVPTTTAASDAASAWAVPLATWPSGSLDDPAVAEGVGELIDDAVAGQRFGAITSVVVAQRGAIVAEGYRNGVEPSTPLSLGALSELAASALFGILARDGGVDVGRVTFYSEWAGDDREEITYAMVLRHLSGLAWNGAGDAARLERAGGSGSGAQFVLGLPLAESPGRAFDHTPANLALLGRFLADNPVSGPDTPAWAQTVLFEPLGITSATLPTDASGTWRSHDGLEISAPDVLRIAMLYLAGGRTADGFILPPDWVDFATTVIEPSTEFGAGFWIDREGPGTWSVESSGQRLVLIPETDTSLIVTSAFTSDSAVAGLTERLVDLLLQPSDT